MIGKNTGVPDRSQDQTSPTKPRAFCIDGNGDGEGDPMESMKQFMMPKGGGKVDNSVMPVNRNPFHSTGAANLEKYGAMGDGS